MSLRPITKETKMTLTLVKLSKNGSMAIYKGLRTVVRLPISAFENKTPAQSFEVEGAFAGPSTPKAKMTPEERKAARAAQPKLTLAEKVERRRQQLAKLEQKLQSESTAASM